MRFRISLCLSCLFNESLFAGRDGLTHNMLDTIHCHWKRRRVCKIKCKGVPTIDMDNVCFQIEVDLLFLSTATELSFVLFFQMGYECGFYPSHHLNMSRNYWLFCEVSGSLGVWYNKISWMYMMKFLACFILAP